jgi:hypothetical protein
MVSYIRVIFALVAGFAVLASAALDWQAIDLEDEPAGTLMKYEKMQLRYQSAAVFFIGVLIVFNAFLSTKFPGVCGVFTYIVCGIILFSITLSERFNPFYCNAARLEYQDIGSSQADYNKRYLASCLLFYGGAILSLFSVDGPGFGSWYKAMKGLSALLVLACTIVSVFLVATSPSSAINAGDPAAAIKIAQDNIINIGMTVFICLLAIAATMSGSHHLVGSTSVIFGVYGFYVLSKLFQHNDTFTATLDTQDLNRIRVGYVFSWFTATAAYLSNIPVYASPDGFGETA